MFKTPSKLVELQKRPEAPQQVLGSAGAEDRDGARRAEVHERVAAPRHRDPPALAAGAAPGALAGQAEAPDAQVEVVRAALGTDPASLE